MTMLPAARTALAALVALLAGAAGCKDTQQATRASSDAETIAKLTELADAMCACQDAACAKRVSEQMTAWSQQQTADQHGLPQMTEADQKRAMELGTKLGGCMQKAMAAGGGAADDPGSAAGSAAQGAGSADANAPGVAIAPPPGLPPECAEYQAVIEKLQTCDQIAKQARETLLGAYNQVAAGWANLPEPARASIAEPCKAGTRAVVAAAKAQCGWE